MKHRCLLSTALLAGMLLPTYAAAATYAAPAAPAPDVAELSIRAGSLTMVGLHYDGVVQARRGTARGSRLRFSMDRAVLTDVQGRAGRMALRAESISLGGGVAMDVGRFSARMGGLLPLTFTPAEPPPLVLPGMRFDTVTVNAAEISAGTAEVTGFSLGTA